MDKKPTKKLDVEELEKRKAPFASPITYRDGEGTGSATTESTARSDRVGPPPPEPQEGLPKPPIVDRIRND